jgi:energy-coupling factor transport system permease protein
VRAVNRLSLPRNLHPGAWWLWAIALAAAASRTTNPLVLALVIAVAGFVVAARRGDGPQTRAFVAFLKLGLVLIAVRVVLQAVLSRSGQGTHVLLTMPEVPLPQWAAGVKLGGVVTTEAVLTAFYQGLQLATILCCVGAANALASARRLLSCLPGALYEVGVAVVVALTFAPQLVVDAARVRAAHRLRGQAPGRWRAWRRTALPVLEGALDRSLELAAAMDTRGYGRTGDASPVSRRVTGALVLTGLLGICVGVYGLLDASAAVALGLPTLLAGCLLASCGLVVGGRRTRRSRYRPDPWALPEWAVVGSGAAAALAAFITSLRDPAALQLAGPLVVPPVPVLALCGVLVAIAPAWLTPPPPRAAPRRPEAPRAEQLVGVAR